MSIILPLPCPGPDPNVHYHIQRPTQSDPTLPISTKCSTVTISLSRPPHPPTTLSFTLFSNQVQPWLDHLCLDLSTNQSATLLDSSDKTICTATVTHLSPPQPAPTTDSTKQLKDTAGEVFRSANRFPEYRQAVCMYLRTLDEVNGLQKEDPIIKQVLATNLALCFLRMNEWSLALAWASAAQGNKARYRECMARVELGDEVAAVAGLRKVGYEMQSDKVVSKQVERVDREVKSAMEKRRDQFAEVYSCLIKSTIFEDVLVGWK